MGRGCIWLASRARVPACRDTLSVFLPEAGQPAVRPFDRAFLEQQLKVAATPNASRL